MEHSAENEISHSTVQDVRGQNETQSLLAKEQNDPIYVADSNDQDELGDAKEDCRGPTDARH